MAKKPIETSTDVLEYFADLLAEKIAARLKGSSGDSLFDNSDDESSDSNEVTKEDFEAKIDEATDASSKAEVMAVLGEYGYKNPRRVKEEDYAELCEELDKLIDEDGDGDADGDGEDVTLDAVKKMLTAAKKVDRAEADSVLKEYNTTVRKLGSLDQTDLNELFEDLQEMVQGED